MRVESGAGEFELKILKFAEQDGNVVMIGKMGYWETKLILTPKEAMGLAKGMIIPMMKSILKILKY